VCYIKGQQEIGAGGLHHWQLLVVTSKKCTLKQVKDFFCKQAHVELSRSSAANEYVWKEETRVANTQFEVGALPINRAKTTDWDRIYTLAKEGQFEEIPKDVLIRNYSAIKRIRVDCIRPDFRPDINVRVYWGKSGTGKTRRAFHEAGEDVYIKNPNTKWWDGYRGQKNVIIDEFIGRIDISYILKWLDRYPCIIEIKGYSMPLEAINFWITSNVSPEDWYTDINAEQRRGLMRRLTYVCHFLTEWTPD